MPHVKSRRPDRLSMLWILPMVCISGQGARPSDGSVREPNPNVAQNVRSVDLNTLDADAKDAAVASPFLEELRQALEQVPAPGGAMAVRDGEGDEWSGAVGRLDLARQIAAEPTSRFRIWSISKTMTAAIVLQLAEERSVRLDDPISTWFPKIPNSTDISIQHLLTHTSGIADYLTTPEVQSQLDQPFTPDGLIEIAARRSPVFPPGGRWQYSNSNFVLLGQIVERVTGRTLTEQLIQRIFEPLRMRDTVVWDTPSTPSGTARGYQIEGGSFVDVTDVLHPSLVYATGPVVSTAEDLRRWCIGLIEGPILSEEMKARAFAPSRLADGTPISYGLGIGVFDTTEGRVLLHGGGPLLGYTAAMSYLMSRRALIVTVTNGSSTDALEPILAAGWITMLRIGVEQRAQSN